MDFSNHEGVITGYANPLPNGRSISSIYGAVISLMKMRGRIRELAINARERYLNQNGHGIEISTPSVGSNQWKRRVFVRAFSKFDTPKEYSRLLYVNKAINVAKLIEYSDTTFGEFIHEISLDPTTATLLKFFSKKMIQDEGDIILINTNDRPMMREIVYRYPDESMAIITISAGYT